MEPLIWEVPVPKLSEIDVSVVSVTEIFNIKGYERLQVCCCSYEGIEALGMTLQFTYSKLCKMIEEMNNVWEVLIKLESLGKGSGRHQVEQESY